MRGRPARVFDAGTNAKAQTAHTYFGTPLDALNVGGTGCNAWNEGLESQTTTGTPSTLLTVVNNWMPQSGCANNPQLQSVTTTNDAGQVKQVSFTYDQYNNVVNQKEYDWGSGAAGGLLRETRNSYVTSANYTGLNLVRLLARTTVLDGAGNLASDSTYDYDLNYTPGNAICTAGLGHDNQNFAGPSPRGNLGRISQYLNTSGTWITTDTRAYDMSGNLTSEADGNNHTTSFSYNDNFPDAHPTTCGFVTGIFNGLGQAVFQAQYDYSLGRATVTADPTGHYTIHESGTLAFGLDKPARARRAFQTPLENSTTVDYRSPTWVVTSQDQNTAQDTAQGLALVS